MRVNVTAIDHHHKDDTSNCIHHRLDPYLGLFYNTKAKRILLSTSAISRIRQSAGPVDCQLRIKSNKLCSYPGR